MTDQRHKDGQLTEAENKENRLQAQWAIANLNSGLDRCKTGIGGFDEVLQGGLPKGRATLIQGSAGTGKTMFLCEFLYRGIEKYGESGVLVTFEEKPDDIVRHVAGFGWDIKPLLESGQIVIVDCTPSDSEEISTGDAEWIRTTLVRIQLATRRNGATRLAIDNLRSAALRFQGAEDYVGYRDLFLKLLHQIKSLELTALISLEAADNNHANDLAHAGFYASEGVIELSIDNQTANAQRSLNIVKLRGCNFRRGAVAYDITANGLLVYPKIPVDTSVGETSFEVRETFGIAPLDNAMGGGIPQGHIFMVTGNTGTGKSTLAMQYVHEGLSQGKNTVWVAIEETVSQVTKTAMAHDWDFAGAASEGRLRFVTTDTLNIQVDKLLYHIVDAVVATDAHRVVVDSISSLESAALNKSDVRDFLLQLAGFVKSRGLTLIVTYLNAEAFGAANGQLLGSLATNEMRLSSIVDGILVMRYVERSQGVTKLLNILKLRGSNHDKDIFQYEIEHSGIVLKGRFAH